MDALPLFSTLTELFGVFILKHHTMLTTHLGSFCFFPRGIGFRQKETPTDTKQKRREPLLTDGGITRGWSREFSLERHRKSDSPICASSVTQRPFCMRPYFADVTRITWSGPHEALKVSQRQNSCTAPTEWQVRLRTFPYLEYSRMANTQACPIVTVCTLSTVLVVLCFSNIQCCHLCHVTYVIW